MKLSHALALVGVATFSAFLGAFCGTIVGVYVAVEALFPRVIP